MEKNVATLSRVVLNKQFKETRESMKKDRMNGGTRGSVVSARTIGDDEEEDEDGGQVTLSTVLWSGN